MVNRPSIPEIITVNSETLQTQIRDLLPSQSGFGSELQATNVITPVIDLTAAAEGSQLRSDLQSALAFGSVTEFNVNNTTTTIINQAGFWRITGSVNMNGNSTSSQNGLLELNDGSTDKILYNWRKLTSSSLAEFWIESFDVTIWFRSGDSCNVGASADATVQGVFRQLATGDGTLVNPSGYPL